MQGPTHLVTGILIQKGMRKIRPLPLQYFLIALLAIMTHGILDKLARFTYHPPDPLTNDLFWISYHLFIASLTIFIFVRYWKNYKLGLIFSILPDFDWVVIHTSNFLSFSVSFWKDEILHKLLFSFLDFLIPFSFLNTLPNLSFERIGVLPEITLFSTLLFVVHIMDKKKSDIKKEKHEIPALAFDNMKKEIITKNNDDISTSGWVEKLQIYQTAFDHEQNIRIAYQSLLTTLEVGLFALFFTLYQMEFKHLWILFVIGIFLCFPFGIACEFRARNVDILRMYIVSIVKDTDVWDAFKDAKYRWIPSIPSIKAGFLGEYLFGHWFERILITGMLIIWVNLLWYFPCPFLIRLCGILSVIGWIIYAFRIIELRGEIIPYLRRG